MNSQSGLSWCQLISRSTKTVYAARRHPTCSQQPTPFGGLEEQTDFSFHATLYGMLLNAFKDPPTYVSAVARSITKVLGPSKDATRVQESVLRRRSGGGA